MELLKFRLSGKTAFFKNPEVNSYLYFSYGNIHKIAVLGILGAILGLKGYNQQEDRDIYPEFYEKLKEIQISIVPINNKGSFNKKIQNFNNSVGYASQEEGGNLIVTEEWLENVIWDIYIKLDNNPIVNLLKERFLKKQFKHTIYLGKNDHLANVTDVQILNGELIKEDVDEIISLFVKSHAKKSENTTPWNLSEKEIFRYQEKLPYKLDKISNQYVTEDFVFTNEGVSILTDTFVKINRGIIELF